jgi:hypothetical protein
MSVFVIPNSNPLRFVRTDAQAVTTYKTLDSQLGELNKFGRQTFYNNLQKWNTADIILLQLSTDYTTITVKTFTNEGVEVATISPTLAYAFLDDSGISMWDYYISTSAMGGVYYVQIDASGDGRPTLQFKSDCFEVDSYSDYIYITYTKKERSGIYYGGGQTFVLRAEGYLWEADFDENEEAYTGYNNAIELLKSDVSRILKLKIFALPLGVITSIRLALSHETVTINGVSVSKKGKVKVTPVNETNLYELECDLQDIAFEDYTSLTDQGGQPSDEGFLLYSDTVTDITLYDDSETSKVLTY